MKRISASIKSLQKFPIRLQQDPILFPVRDTVSVKGASVHSKRMNILQNWVSKGLTYVTINPVAFWTSFVRHKR